MRRYGVLTWTLRDPSCTEERRDGFGVADREFVRTWESHGASYLCGEYMRAGRTYADDVPVSLMKSLQPVVPVPGQSQEAPPDLRCLAPERSRVAREWVEG